MKGRMTSKRLNSPWLHVRRLQKQAPKPIPNPNNCDKCPCSHFSRRSSMLVATFNFWCHTNPPLCGPMPVPCYMALPLSITQKKILKPPAANPPPPYSPQFQPHKQHQAASTQIGIKQNQDPCTSRCLQQPLTLYLLRHGGTMQCKKGATTQYKASRSTVLLVAGPVIMQGPAVMREAAPHRS